jgi:hypothetical protein
MGYWQDVTHQRSFMEQLSPKLNVYTYQDWFRYDKSCSALVNMLKGVVVAAM